MACECQGGKHHELQGEDQNDHEHQGHHEHHIHHKHDLYTIDTMNCQVTKSGEAFSAGPIMGTKMMPVPRLEVSVLH